MEAKSRNVTARSFRAATPLQHNELLSVTSMVSHTKKASTHTQAHLTPIRAQQTCESLHMSEVFSQVATWSTSASENTLHIRKRWTWEYSMTENALHVVETIQKPGNHPDFRKKALGAERPFSELWESSGALGIVNSILGVRNSILGMASHDLINTKPTILGATLGAIPGIAANPPERFSFAPSFSERFFENWGGPRGRRNKKMHVIFVGQMVMVGLFFSTTEATIKIKHFRRRAQ